MKGLPAVAATLKGGAAAAATSLQHCRQPLLWTAMAAPPVLRGSEPPPTRDVLPEPLTLPGMSPTTPTPSTVISRGRARRRDPATSPAPHPHHHRPKLFRLQLPIKRQLGGGYLFGLLVGFVADSISATIGATTAFLLGRTNIATQIKDRTLVESF